MSSDKERARIVELAEKYVKKGKLQEAIIEYRKLLTGTAQDIGFRNIISDLCLRMNHKVKAVEELNIVAAYYDDRGLYSQSMAIYKKIIKLAPENADAAKKLADLYFSQGFLSEAKAEYLKVARDLRRNNRIKEAISLYEKIMKLDKRDNQIKITLADLFTKEKSFDQAIDLLNEVAEFKIRTNALKEARDILNQARKLREDHPRTLSNLIDLLKKENKKKEALGLVNDILKKDGTNVSALKILGNFYFEDQDFKKAEEIFSKAVSLRPKDVEARVKLGRISIHHDNLDHAYELYEPLIEVLIKKQKFEKAIGLLGLILSSRKVHIPTLEKLVAIYRSTDNRENLEIVARVLLEEYYKIGLFKKSLPLLKNLVEICPDDLDLRMEYDRVRTELGVSEEEIAAEASTEIETEAEMHTEVEKEFREPAMEEQKEEEFLEKEEFREVAEEAKEPEVPVVEREAEAPPFEAEKGVEAPPPMEEERVEIPVEEEKVVEAPSFEPPPVEVSPPEAPYAEEPPKAKERVEIPVEEEVIEAPPQARERGYTEYEEGSREMLEMNLTQADLYIEQGLVRNARRILENLRLQFPDDPRIDEKLAVIRDAASAVSEDEILQRIGSIAKKETKLFKKKPDVPKEKEEGKFTAADIFGNTGIITDESGGDGKKYYDFAERIDEELEAIKAIFELQLKGSTTSVEKSLADIVSEFRKGVEKNVDKKDHDSHFNLGIAFLEQGLLDDAIEEFKLASTDEKSSVECYSLISSCYRKKKNFQEAANWLEKALKITGKGSGQFLALKYELASCYEDLGEAEKSLAIYNEIRKLDPEYRDVAKKIKALSKGG